jgi:hypothetical protein
VKLHVLVTAVVMATAAPAVGQTLAPAGVDEILAGTRSCASVTTTKGVDAHKLETDGWGKASVTANDKPLAAPMVFYGKGHLLLTFNPAGAKPICILTARISTVADFPKVQAAFASAFGSPVKDDGKGEQLFIAADHRIVDLTSSGNAERPSVRVAVGPVIQEAK